MPGRFGRTPHIIWLEDDYTDLSPEAQHLDYLLRHSPEISACGRHDWRPVRLIQRARGWTEEQIRAAAGELEERGFAVFDDSSEEAIVVRHMDLDELLRNPKSAIAVHKGYQSVASKRCRGAVADEIRRLRVVHPEYSSWTSRLSAELMDWLLARPGLAGTVPDLSAVAAPITNPDPEPDTRNTNGITNPDRSGSVSEPAATEPAPDPESDTGITNRNGNPPAGITNRITNPDRSGSPNAYRLTPTKDRGYVEGVRHHAPATDRDDSLPGPHRRYHPEHPSRWIDGCAVCDRLCDEHLAAFHAFLELAVPAAACPAHIGHSSPPKCGACAAARKFREHYDRVAAAWRAEAAAIDRQRHFAARTAAIDACDRCDDLGYVGMHVCDHADPRGARPDWRTSWRQLKTDPEYVPAALAPDPVSPVS